MTTDKVQKSALENLKNDIALVQKCMEDNITEGNPKTAKWLYEQLSDKLSKQLTQPQFQQSLSANVKVGNITGFEGRRKVGYVLVGTPLGASRTVLTADDEDGEEVAALTDEHEAKFFVQISKNMRLMPLDKRNVGRQILVNGIWTNQAYYPNLTDAVKHTAKYLLNHKVSKGEAAVKLQELGAYMERIEQQIMTELQEMKQELPSVPEIEGFEDGPGESFAEPEAMQDEAEEPEVEDDFDESSDEVAAE